MTAMRTGSLIGRRVQWNQTEVAEIVEQLFHVNSRQEPEVWVIVRRPCGMLVLKRTDFITLLPD